MQFLCSLWRGRSFDRDTARYDTDDVEYIANALSRYGHSLTCVHDGSFMMPSGVSQIVMPPEVAALPDYQPKLWMWSPELHARFTKPFAHIDLDTLILGDPAEVFHKKHPLQFWSVAKLEPYNTSLVYVTPGHGNEVWANRHRIEEAKADWPRWTGDQSLVGWVLGPHHYTFGPDEGIYAFRISEMEIKPPKNALVVFFFGAQKPGDWADRVPWIRKELMNKPLHKMTDKERLAYLPCRPTEPSKVIIQWVKRYNFKRGAEIGVLGGKTLFALMKECRSLKMYAVDQWIHVPFRADEAAETYASHNMDTYRKRVWDYASKQGDMCTVLEGDSVEQAQYVPDGSLDFVFIDADHTEVGFERDFRAWVPKVRYGGLVIGHDASWPTIQRVLDRLAPSWAAFPEEVWCIPRRLVEL